MKIHLLLAALLYIPQVSTGGLISISSPLVVPSNAQSGDELLSEVTFHVLDRVDEDVALSLSPASDSVSLAPAIVAPGGSFKVILNDKQELMNGIKDFKIEAIGTISGEAQEAPLSIIFANDTSSIVTEGVLFVKDAYDLKLETALQEREIALVELRSAAPAALSYSLSGAFSDHFSVHPDGSQLVITSQPCPSCRLPPSFSLVLTAHSSPPSHAVLNFISGPEPLHFSKEVYKCSIEEGSSSFSKLIKLRVPGVHEVVFSLEDGSGIFAVHPTTGLLSVQHPEFLLRDSVGEKIRLSASAFSGGRKARASIHVKVLPRRNETHLHFTQDNYHFDLPAAERNAGSLSIEGATGPINYRLSEGDSSLFEINNGDLKFIGDFLKEDRNYSVVVVALSNSSLLSTAITRVTVSQEGIASNVVKLSLPAYAHSQISSDAKVGSVLTSVEVEDVDDDSVISFSLSKVRYTDSDGRSSDEQTADSLALDSEGKKATVMLKKSIEGQKISSISFSVIAKDAKHPKEPSVVANREVFVVHGVEKTKKLLPLSLLETPPSAMLPAALPSGSFVYQFLTLPDHEDERTNFVQLKPSAYFRVHSNGLVSVLSSPPSGHREMIEITASRGEETLKGSLSIEVSETSTEPPRFMHPKEETNIASNAPPGTIVSNNTLFGSHEPTFSLSGSELFEVDQKGVVRTSGPLSTDILHHVLLLTASTETGSAISQIRVNVDTSADQLLEFSLPEYSAEILENIPINSFVALIVVSKQNGPVKYSIEADDNKSSNLDIDDNGRVTAKEEFFGEVGDRVFVVRASRGAKEASTKLRLTVRPAFSCIPQFLPKVNDILQIKENLEEGAEIGQISALTLDEKCELQFAFWDSSRLKAVYENEVASIDKKTGRITAKKTFDYEKMRSYSMVLALLAGQRHVVQHASQLMVVDVDDHTVQFSHPAITVEVLESAAVGSTVATVRATDRDASQSVFYKAKTTVPEWSVDSRTGEVKVSKALDRETKDEWMIEVGVSNSADTPVEDITMWTSVHVIVKDVNDNGPLFEKARYEILVASSQLPGQELLTVRAKDPDMKESGSESVYYSIEDTVFEYHGMRRPLQGIFSIDQLSGKITLAQSVSDFVGGLFHVALRSADSLEGSARKDKSVLRVLVHDASDVVYAELQKSALTVHQSDVSNITQAIHDATGLKVLVKQIGYHAMDGITINDVCRVNMVLMNQTSLEIVPAERVVAMMERLKSTGTRIPTVRRTSKSSSVGAASSSPLLLILGIFSLAIILVSIVFALLICSYRTRYEKQVDLHHDDLVITNSIAQPLQRPLVISPPMQRAHDIYAVPDHYQIQERRLSVGVDENPRRKR